VNTLYLETQVTVSRDCASFYFQDVTPEYNLLTNPNGYDLTGVNCVNPADIDISALTVQVTNLANPSSPVTVNIPASAFDDTRIPGVVQYNITSTNLGYTLSDGIYKFVYTVVDGANNDQVYQRTCYVLNDCNICCSLDQKLKDLKECGSCNEKNNRSVNMLYEAYMLRQKAHHLVACHDFAGAQQVLDYLSRLLDIKYCDSCNNNS
jgi:hypothetical protein